MILQDLLFFPKNPFFYHRLPDQLTLFNNQFYNINTGIHVL